MHLTALFTRPKPNDSLSFGEGEMETLTSLRHWVRPPGEAAKKLLLIMKLTAIFLLSACLSVAARTEGQTVTLSVQDAPMKLVFREIQKQTGLNIMVKESLLEKAGRITIQVTQMPVADVLNLCLKNLPLGYTIENNTIVVKEKPAPLTQVSGLVPGTPEPSPTELKIRVVDTTGSPLQGATVSLNKKTIGVTDAEGVFSLNVNAGDVIFISSVSFETSEYKITSDFLSKSSSQTLILTLKPSITSLDDVEVTINTGYQRLKPNEVTGSVAQIDNQLFNRRVSTDVLSRLDGIVAGMYFSGFNSPLSQNLQSPPATKLGVEIRGRSTIQSGLVSADPLIVIDNFVYDGEINNINPNNIESITILKDAAAASIWGARAGNGVIVISTKKAAINQKIQVNVNSNLTISDQPNLRYGKGFLNSSDFIDAELSLYKNGFFDAQISNTFSRPPLSPVVEMLANRKAGLITSADSASQLDVLRKVDVRKDYDKYVYQKAIMQQYNVNLSGGTKNFSQFFSVGYDKNRDNLVRNGYDRISITSVNTYRPIQNLEISNTVLYTQSNTQQSNQFGINTFAIGGSYGSILPYAQLADANGNFLPVVKTYRYAWVDTIQRSGYFDWRYRPLQEMMLGNYKINVKDILLQSSLKYSFSHNLSVQVQFQHESQIMAGKNDQSVQSFAVRNLINQFSVANGDGSFNYNFPVGDILSVQQRTLSSNNLRGQINYNKTFHSKHNIFTLFGSEIRESKSEGSSYNLYGYDDETGTSVSSLNFNTRYTLFPNFSSSRLPTTASNITGSIYRFISFFGNAGYSYNTKYTITISARRDGANLFGVKTNDKIKPFWSSGLKWDINKETFYKISWLPILKLRASYGTEGNVYNGGAYLTGRYFGTSDLTNAPIVQITTPPNPELRWETVKIINIGTDFGFHQNTISGSIEWYQKNGTDLIEPAPLAPSTGFISFTGNAASTRTRGIEMNLSSKVVDNRFKWYTSLLLSTQQNVVTHYDPKFQAINLVNSISGVAIEGKSLFSIFSYKWAGLDPNTGDPQGYLNKTVSKDYPSILSSTSVDSLVYNGSARPTVFGAFLNSFTIRNISLSINITYNFGYYFRRPGVNSNLQGIIANPNSDYSLRWQKTGDEKNTSVPSIVYPANSARNNFYQFSEALVEKGDHIRLKDVQLSYNVSRQLWRKMPFATLQVYCYVTNLALIWKANKSGLDPDYYNQLALPGKSMSFGLRAGF
ncbi:MAG: SusC/RagA family TonB-linked outer membrane protein [Chitinophagaceae bacterium]